MKSFWRKSLVLSISLAWALLGQQILAAEAECDACADCVEAYLKRLDERGYLGIVFHAHRREEHAGLDIRRVDPSGPAARIGLREGDEVRRLEGLDLTAISAEELEQALGDLQPGQRVELTVTRGDRTFEATLQARRLSPTARATALGAYLIRQRSRRSESHSQPHRPLREQTTPD